MSESTHSSSHRSAAHAGTPLLYRVLAQRESGGLSVRLFWSARDDELFVHVQDEQTGDDFVLNPHKSQALFAYHHPYAAANQALKAGKIAA
jgi:hypothetical protein